MSRTSSEVTFSLTILRDETYYYVLRDRTRKRERESRSLQILRGVSLLGRYPAASIDVSSKHVSVEARKKPRHGDCKRKRKKKRAGRTSLSSPCCPIASLVLTERAERRAGTRELSSLLDLASERDTCRSPLPQPGPFPRHESRVCVRCTRIILDPASEESPGEKEDR